MMSIIACCVECDSRKPYCALYSKSCFSMNEIILEYISFSNILLKLDKRDIGLKLLASFTLSDLNTGTILDSLSLFGYTPSETEMFISAAKGSLMVSFTSFNNCVGQEYRP